MSSTKTTVLTCMFDRIQCFHHFRIDYYEYYYENESHDGRREKQSPELLHSWRVDVARQERLQVLEDSCFTAEMQQAWLQGTSIWPILTD